MRRQNRRQAFVATFVLLLVMVFALTGCLSRRDPPVVPTGVVPTVGATTVKAEVEPDPTLAATVTLPATQAATSVAPRVVIAPTNGPAGTEVQAVASGFRPDTTVRVGLGRQSGQVVTSTTAQSDTSGRLVLTMVIPDSAEIGDHWLVIAQIVGQPVQAMSNLFEVTEPAAEQTVQVVPGSATAGTQLQVTGAGFPAETQVEVSLGPSGAEPVVVVTPRTHADGAVEATIEVPQSAVPGETWVVTITSPDGALKVISGGVEILAAATSPTPVAEATQPAPIPTQEPIAGPTVTIYLIALEDGGISGPLIGCGDSVVPVKVPVVPTQAVLRASMEQLLALKDQYFGESGLYNALYQSHLTVGAIGLSAGQATINLSGSLLIGGTCDAPRVKAQLEQTALQFSTVDQVTIFVNGVPLDSVLSGQ